MGGARNKLRVYAAVLGGGLSLLSLWAAVAYGARTGEYASFALAGGAGVVVAAAPSLFAHGKLWLERRRQGNRGDQLYASAPLDVSRESFIDDTESVLESSAEVGGVKRRDFPEGDGLVVEHTTFHGTFVRLSETNRVVVTGIRSAATQKVVAELEAAWSTVIDRTSANPFLAPIPVRGAPRVFLGLLLTALVVVDAVFLVGLAYPGATYNPGEKAVLVGYDLQADLDPGTSPTDAKLAKAGFLVSVLREEATEIAWRAGVNNSSVRDTDADVVSADITRLLAEVRRSDPDQGQRARIAELEREHARAREAVAAAIADAERNDSAGTARLRPALA